MANTSIESRFRKLRDLQGSISSRATAKAEYNKQFKSLLKVADQRLVEIERISEQVMYAKRAIAGDSKAMSWINRHNIPGVNKKKDIIGGLNKFVERYDDLESFAYAKAKFNLDQRFNSTRFNRKANYATADDERGLLGILEKFLTSDTSSKQGIKRYETATKAFNKFADSDLTWQDFARFANSETFNEMKTVTYSSDVVVKSIGKMRELSRKELDDFVDLVKENSKNKGFKNSNEYKEMMDKLKINEDINDPENKELLRMIEKGDFTRLLREVK